MSVSKNIDVAMEKSMKLKRESLIFFMQKNEQRTFFQTGTPTIFKVIKDNIVNVQQ